MNIIEAYPLQYPKNWRRTPHAERKPSRFGTSFASARDGLIHEIKLLGGVSPILSTNIPLKRDGLPYANFREPEDSGVAVYFQLFGEQQCIPCDKWKKVSDNLHAINLTIKALRGLERWGAKDMVRASFQGFKALPQEAGKGKTEYFSEDLTKEELIRRYRELANKLHPDKGGNKEEFIEMKQQYEKRLDEEIKNRKER